MRVLIVDDEPLARLRLRTMLADHADVEVVGECEDAVEAARAIEGEQPDLVFLDVQLPQVDGFSLLQSITAQPAPQVVFATAHPHYAVRAFEADAVDYLLKPYDEQRLARSVERARGQLALQKHCASERSASVSNYELLERLGSGGMGVVYKARDRRLRRTVVLKFLQPQSRGGAALEPRLLQEAKAAAALDHPNVCAIHGVEQAEDGRPCLVMPFYEGETLESKIAGGRLKVDKAVDCALQIAAGLEHAHAAGIVHRDIKPANLLETRAGLVKILDFGIAKIADARLTGTGAVIGTLAYMSPEQAAGERVNHRTDLWALGAVLYEMLAGRPPFGGSPDDSVYHLFYSIQLKHPAPLEELRSDVPIGLARIVDRLLEKAPERRFINAASVIAALAAFRKAGSPVC